MTARDLLWFTCSDFEVNLSTRVGLEHALSAQFPRCGSLSSGISEILN